MTRAPQKLPRREICNFNMLNALLSFQAQSRLVVFDNRVTKAPRCHMISDLPLEKYMLVYDGRHLFSNGENVMEVTPIAAYASLVLH